MQVFRLMSTIIFYSRAMTYSSISVLSVLLMILLLALEHTSEGIEYHVKPTDREFTQCPGQHCHTLAEYLENKTWDYTYHARVMFMPGVTQSFSIRSAFNLTLLGSIQVSTTPFMIHAPSFTLVYFGLIVSST